MERSVLQRVRLISDINVSQGSVVTFVRCGGLFNYTFITNLPLRPLVKVLKSVSVWRSYGLKYSGAIYFLSGHGRIARKYYIRPVWFVCILY